MMSVGCSEPAVEQGFEWAVNVGGGAYTSTDGIEYSAEEFVSGGKVGELDEVLGSQDPTLYYSYREGDIRVDKPIANGVYDIILHFAEPAEIEGRERLFDVFVNDKSVIRELDVMVSRDGKIKSALTVAIPGIEVTNGHLLITFSAAALEPVLSALVVRGRAYDSDSWRLVWSDEFDYEGPPDPTKPASTLCTRSKMTNVSGRR